MPRPSPTWPIAAGSLLVGFGVAEVTGVRALGGVVLAGAAAWCLRAWVERVGVGRAVGLVALYAGGFAGAHVLADVAGAWPAVALVAAVVGAVAWRVADSPRGTAVAA